MEKDLYMTISSKTKQLLVKQEGFDADFKMTVKGIQATDLVAFANSENGGTILAGVGEVEDKNSMQKGRIIGCPVGDKERLFILSKAESCVPPVEVAIIIENYARKPIYRIEIPSGKEKPYCTAGGTYKIRGDGRTNTLLPGRLLTLYIEKQSETFFNRFREATKELGKDILASDTLLQNALNELRRKVLQIESAIGSNQNSLEKIEAIDKKIDKLLSLQAKGE
ncbi:MULTISPECIES: ATP-binding protein [Dehalobacter]|jgi:predicted HTH transcriptional regulator|uniref:ATP-binding protein n=2 Tax=Dehalobacter restrictus TaxID=55583 RepID=A0A857DGG1_9FIRM|nr:MULTISPECIES: ATP-binding protein [Dehalobacter]AHF08867.1 transcriptional regulator [Dehalobacter restrictus DSM 9455]MDJ0305449.1 ATP-binding protein [Dehalobacter sp.]OCZ50043.1 transcriptional regulator [Dehalobacter sp. TeCB1]QGZ99364.1 ATP-binding protein [Dehalobacter restrictus]